MNKGRDILLGSLAVLAVVGSLYFIFGNRSQRVNLGTYEVLGAVTAEETAKLINHHGRVLVMARDLGENTSTEAELEAFARTLKKHSGVSVITEKVQVAPMDMMATGGSVPPETLFNALEKHPDLAALVLFFAFPQLADSELERLRQYKAKTVVVSSLRPEYERLLDEQTIQMAIVPRPDALETGNANAGTLRERFDQEFVVFKASP
ncbi:MAG: hypothetical protein AB9869_26095 [Verrucomicrobiia bacterium]